MLKVCKFGGSSLADADGFLRVRQIVTSDIARRVVVVSAPGKRHADDQKITDLLYLCHAHLRYGVSCWELWRRIADRFIAIRDGCGLHYPIERELERVYAELSGQTGIDALASRGEYFAARLMAELLGFAFLDAADWLRFDANGVLDRARSYAELASLADGRKIVTPGFYGALPDGRIHTFSRGGSDVTGGIAAAALRAEVYENWTDVPGVLTADPRLVPQQRVIGQMRYEELDQLAQLGLQVLHEDAVAPLRERQIPLIIRSTFEPERPGTTISAQLSTEEDGIVGFAGRRNVAMLRVELPCAHGNGELPGAVTQTLEKQGASPLACCAALGQVNVLLDMPQAQTLRTRLESLRAALGARRVELRENLSILLAICRTTEPIPALLAAIERAGVPVHHIQRAAPALLMVVNDSQYVPALRAAAAAAFPNPGEAPEKAPPADLHRAEPRVGAGKAEESMV